MDIYSWLGSGAVITMVGLCFKMVKDGDTKINRLYKRLDEVKDAVDVKYTKKEVCDVTHRNVDTQLLRIGLDVSEIKNDIKIMLKNRND